MGYIGIMSAMAEEMDILLESLENKTTKIIGQREYNKGKLWNKDVVLVFSRWGKVAASSTTTTLITEFNVDEIIFTGVAGAIDENVNIGDIIIGESLCQHDFDASPFLLKHVLPLIMKKELDSNPIVRENLYEACNKFISDQIKKEIDTETLREFNITNPKAIIGNIASGDQFIKTDTRRKEIKSDLENVMAVEMEGAAVAQICFEYDVPLGVIRTISDDANDHAIDDFPKFVSQVASKYSYHILKNYLD